VLGRRFFFILVLLLIMALSANVVAAQENCDDDKEYLIERLASRGITPEMIEAADCEMVESAFDAAAAVFETRDEDAEVPTFHGNPSNVVWVDGKEVRLSDGGWMFYANTAMNRFEYGGKKYQALAISTENGVVNLGYAGTDGLGQVVPLGGLYNEADDIGWMYSIAENDAIFVHVFNSDRLLFAQSLNMLRIDYVSRDGFAIAQAQHGNHAAIGYRLEFISDKWVMNIDDTSLRDNRWVPFSSIYQND
jgi:hypothetical protein